MSFKNASKVPRQHIFCVAGNHDIDRNRQNLCFLGARVELQSQNQVDVLLEGGEELETLLKREDNYRQFQSSYFTDQTRICTTDGLGYVSRLAVEEIQMAIVGLDSAWLSKGGHDDHGKLLIGERQVINAIELAQGGNAPANIIVGMAHHPLHMLEDFDRNPVQNRIEEIFNFFHCGHLHDPEVRTAGAGISGSGCLTLTAGALFETRRSHNTYHIVKIDLLRAVREVESFQYDPSKGIFSMSGPPKKYNFEVTPVESCDVGELAAAMQTYCPALARWAHYLSALVLNQKDDFPILTNNSHIFGSFNLLRDQPDSDLKHKTAKFLAFKKRSAFPVQSCTTTRDTCPTRHRTQIVW